MSAATAEGRAKVDAKKARVQQALMRIQPRLLRRGDAVWRVLRRFRPVVRIKKAVVLTRHADVRDVLERDDAFSVTYGPKMEQITGPFILGWDDGDQHRHERAALRAAARDDDADLARVGALTRERAAAVLAGGADGAGADAVRFADEAVGAGLEGYFGLPELADRESRDHARAVFRAVFLDTEAPGVLEGGHAGSAWLLDRIYAAMARAKDNAPTDDVLGRLLAAGDLKPEDIPRNLVGLVAAWSASVPRSFSLALDALFDHPAELERVSGHARDHNEEVVGRLWLEALRLQPQAPFLVRKCRHAMVLAPGSPREQRLNEGDVVVAVTMSGMRDKHTLDAPDALIPDRGPEEYLHFGAGIHTCFGAAISVRQFGVLGAALLGAGEVRRAAPLVWEDSFPARLPLAR